MKAILLAAGRGSRLHPYTQACPKCLTEVGGMSLIGRLIKTLRECGVEEIVIITGYCSHMLALPNTTQVNNPNWESTNMVESLFCANKLLGDDVIVSYTDIVYEPRVLKALLDSDNDVSVVVDKKWRSYWEFRFEDPLADAESLRINEGGDIVDIGNKVTNIDEIEAQYMGLLRFKGCGIEELRRAYGSLQHSDRDWKKKRSPQRAYMTDLLMEMILMGVNVHAVPVKSGWLEIDTVDDFERVNSLFENSTISRFFDPSS